MMKLKFLILLIITPLAMLSQTRAEELAKAYQDLANGQKDSALDTFLRLIEDDPADPEALIGVGIVYYEMRKPNSSLDAMNEARNLNDDDPRPFYYMGLVHIDHRNFKAAQPMFERAYSLDSLYTEVNYYIGACLMEQGKRERAVEYLAHQLAWEGPHAYTYFYLGRNAQYRGKNDTALLYLDSALTVNSEVPRFWMAKGDVYFDLADYESAIGAYSGALLRNDTYNEARYRRGVAFLKTGNAALAVEDLELAARGNSSDTAILEALAEAYQLNMQHLEAAQTYQQLIALVPGDMEYLFMRGLSYLEAESFQSALDDFALLHDAFPNDAAVSFQLGNCYDGLGDLANALYYYNQCLAIEPNHGMARYNKGSVLYALDRKAEACELWKTLLSDDFLSTTAAQTLADYCE